MRLVVIESPWRSFSVALNVLYARAAMSDCLHRGEAGYASHLLYTQPGILRDEIPGERALGIEAGFLWGRRADMRAFYLDRGLSSGMIAGLQEAIHWGQPIELRSLTSWRGPAYAEAMRKIAPMIPDWLPVEWGV